MKNINEIKVGDKVRRTESTGLCYNGERHYQYSEQIVKVVGVTEFGFRWEHQKTLKLENTVGKSGVAIEGGISFSRFNGLMAKCEIPNHPKEYAIYEVLGGV
tara:strand:+ start:112 stop:417 length:306 start_codon:yes stop_codon:yes gene_type:complete